MGWANEESPVRIVKDSRDNGEVDEKGFLLLLLNENCRIGQSLVLNAEPQSHQNCKP